MPFHAVVLGAGWHCDDAPGSGRMDSPSKGLCLSIKPVSLGTADDRLNTLVQPSRGRTTVVRPTALMRRRAPSAPSDKVEGQAAALSRLAGVALQRCSVGEARRRRHQHTKWHGNAGGFPYTCNPLGPGQSGPDVGSRVVFLT